MKSDHLNQTIVFNNSSKFLVPNKTLANKPRSKYWLFSRFSTGWICGLHSDWTQLNYCADHGLNRIEKINLKRRYFFITILRDPVARYLSEYDHIRRGATWRASRYACSTEFENNLDDEKNDEISNQKNDGSLDYDNRRMNQSNSGKCFIDDNLKDLDLEKWMKCDKNLAINRQTRMLADLTKVGCLKKNDNQTQYDDLLLESAKFNLKNRLACFGILEFQKISQFIFESTFDLKFKHSFFQLNRTHSTQIEMTVNNATLEKIKRINNLDMQLYEFGKKILFDRFEQLKHKYDFESFERSKIDSLVDLKVNLDKFPELKLFKKFSKLENDPIIV